MRCWPRLSGIRNPSLSATSNPSRSATSDHARYDAQRNARPKSKAFGHQLAVSSRFDNARRPSRPKEYARLGRKLFIDNVERLCER